MPDTVLVCVRTTSGRVVGGLLAKRTADRSEEGLLLAQRWELDDDFWFREPDARSVGMWIPRESIHTVELYRLGPAGWHDDRAER